MKINSQWKKWLANRLNNAPESKTNRTREANFIINVLTTKEDALKTEKADATANNATSRNTIDCILPYFCESERQSRQNSAQPHNLGVF
jgi:NADH:ubiquinone oxidoreductase subunit